MQNVYEASTSLATFIVNRLLESPSITPQRLLTASSLLHGAELMASHMGYEWGESLPLSEARNELDRLASLERIWLLGDKVDYHPALSDLLSKLEGSAHD
jgi:hypothetical protein